MKNYGSTSALVTSGDLSTNGAERELTASTMSQSQQGIEERAHEKESIEMKTRDVSSLVSDRPSWQNSKLMTDIEISYVTALYAILLLTVGLLLFGDWYSGNTNSEFIFGEGYTMLLMIVSLVWMFSVPLKSRRSSVTQTMEHPEEGSIDEGGSGLLVKTLSLFAAFSELLTFLQIVDSSLVVEKCVTPVAIASSVMKLIYIPAQVCFIVFSRRHVQSRKNVLSCLMVTQIIVTNMILYLWTFIKSKQGTFPMTGSRCHHTIDAFLIENASSAGNSTTSNQCEPTICTKLFPWFYPFCLEFCLTASAMLAEQCLHSKGSSLTTDENVYVAQGTNETQEGYFEQLRVPVATKKLSVTIALIVGIFVLVAHLGIIGVLLVKVNPIIATILWYAGDGFTSLAIILLSLSGIVTLLRSKNRHLSDKAGQEMDVVLILVGAIGAIALSLFRGFPGLVNLGGSERLFAAGVFLSELLVIVGDICQTIFIIVSVRSKAEKRGCVSTASIATLLGLLNLCFWVTSTVDITGLEIGICHKETYEWITQFQTKRYGSSWEMFLLLCFPLAIFYRIHSAVVFYRISRQHKRITEEAQTPCPTALMRQFERYSERKRLLEKRKSQLSNEEEKIRRLMESCKQQIEGCCSTMEEDCKSVRRRMTEMSTPTDNIAQD